MTASYPDLSIDGAALGELVPEQKLKEEEKENKQLRGHRGYKLEELRSYECWSLLTPKLLDSKLINSAFSVVNL